MTIDSETEPRRVHKRSSEAVDEDAIDRDNWLLTDETKFWDYFFQLIDIYEGTSLQVEFHDRVQRCEGNGINWNFWTGPRSSSYTLALKKTIDRIKKVGGFGRGDTAKLKELADKVAKGRKAQIKPVSLARTHDTQEYAYSLWVSVRKSLDNQPLDRWKVANCICDMILALIAVSIVCFIGSGIYNFIFKSD